MKVLLIEDNKTIANNIKKYLELSDFEVLICENGLFWLEVARNNDFAPGVSQKILQLAYGIGMQSADNNQKIAAKYFLSIVDGYVDDEDVKKKLKELEEK